VGIFDRFRSAWRTLAGSNAFKVDNTEQEAIRLIDEGNVIEEEGRIDEAMQHYQAALRLVPNLARAHMNCGNILLQKGDPEAALAAYDNAIKHNPEYAAPHYNKGKLLHELGRSAIALESYGRALEIQPGFSEAHNNIGVVFNDLGQTEKAVDSYQRALAIRPEFAEAYANLGHAQDLLEQFDDAEASLRQAIKIDPKLARAHSHLLAYLSYRPTIDAQALFAEHCRFGECVETSLRANWPKYANTRDPERCLRIGFVSGDLCNHAIAYFFEPVVTCLANYPNLSLHAYYNHPIEDGVSRRLRRYFKHWQPISHLPDTVLAQKIIDDRIDILIDLSGHSGKNRLLTFAHKPAPIQASWMGYPGTTGLSAMDYYFTDRYCLPPGRFDRQFTEKLAYLPASAPFLPFEASPPVNALPAASNGYLTLGSFNRIRKLNPSIIALWSKLLRALPDAKMLLGSMPPDGQHNPLIEWFAREGIARERLSFYPRSDMPSYLALHHQVDFCLDTFPYNGGTTTIHALWMGIPTLTLSGGTAAGRSGGGILSHVGLESFIADDANDFVQKGLSWANHLSVLASVRAGLRARLELSPLRHPEVITAGLERALRIMWQRWCAGLSAASLDADLKSLESTSPPLPSDLVVHKGNPLFDR
jgi:protein O-GlcNAc transferase